MSERTEAPTGKRLGEARGRGQVARSQELNTAAALLLGFWLLRRPGANLVAQLGQLATKAVTTLPTGELTGRQVRDLLVEDVLLLAPQIGLMSAALLVTGVAVTVAQTGLLWAGERPFFDLSRLNPLTGLKRLFSGHGLMEFARAFIKLLVVGWMAYSYLRGRAAEMLTLSQTDLPTALRSWADLAYGLGLRVGGVYLVLAFIDYWYQRRTLMRSLRMTKEEIKEELKTQEGDPLLKGRIRQQQRRMARQRMLSRVPKADVVITNPTHFAVALKYERERMRAPQVVAKGAALVAQRIKDIARENGVPVVENPPLARTLYRVADLDQEVPPDLYLAVAEVLAFVYSLEAKRLVHSAEAPAVP